jgi:hypothetical protein
MLNYAPARVIYGYRGEGYKIMESWEQHREQEKECASSTESEPRQPEFLPVLGELGEMGEMGEMSVGQLDSLAKEVSE